MWSRTAILAAAIFTACTPSIGIAALVANLSTGVDAGGLIPFGNADDDWTVISAPDGVPTGAATVVPRARSTFVDPEPSARWITPTAATNVDAPAGYYVYETTFMLEGGMQVTASVLGRYLADNRLIDIQLNGNVAFNGPNVSGAACGLSGCEEFGSFTGFSIDNTALFVDGVNVLRVKIENQPSSTNPTQFAMDAGVFATPVPEPNGGLLFLMGLGALVAAFGLLNRSHH
jgi:hypothetical protein